MSYYLEDHPNPTLAQYGWQRSKVSGVIGVHTTESGVYFDGPDPGVENTAAFIARRAEPGSYHCMGDADSRLKLVRPRFAAWADITNNAHAMSVSGAMDAARWRDLSPERAAAITRNMGIAAAELVQDAIADGLLASPPPARRITAAEAIAGTKPGFYGHGETNPGTRYDPGTNFDWDLFLSTYAAAIGGSISYQGSTTTSEEDDVLREEDRQTMYNFLDGYFKDIKRFPGDRTLVQNEERVAADLGLIVKKIEALPQAILFDTRVDGRNQFDWDKYNAALEIANAAGATGVEVDVEALAEALAARLPKANAEALVDALAERLAKGGQ